MTKIYAKKLNHSLSTVVATESSRPYSISYLNEQEFCNQRGSDTDRIFFAFRYGGSQRDERIADKRIIELQVPNIQGGDALEVWHSLLPVTAYREGDLQLAYNDQMVMGHLHCDAAAEDIAASTFECYAKILSVVEEHDFANLVRFWNYVPKVNEDIGDLECYQLFCKGRFDAFDHHYRNMLPRLPAASAVGSSGDSLGISFIASRNNVAHLENPRQVSAYHYPKQYGPRSPSFARASYIKWGSLASLFISGTASIVGHLSQHPADVSAQLNETLVNIKSIVDHSVEKGLLNPNTAFGDFSHLRVYLRRPEDLPLAREVLAKTSIKQADLAFLRADICRSELLIEVEGLYEAQFG